MNLRAELAGVLARDARYTIHAYAFVFEALELAKAQKKKGLGRARNVRERSAARSLHVNGRELCHAARELALRQYGLMALTVLALWGIRSTGDLGNIVYNLIASGDLEKAPGDSPEHFENVFDFESALRRDYVLALDDVA